jgi:hypothetical protein
MSSMLALLGWNGPQRLLYKQLSIFLKSEQSSKYRQLELPNTLLYYLSSQELCKIQYATPHAPRYHCASHRYCPSRMFQQRTKMVTYQGTSTRYGRSDL